MKHKLTVEITEAPAGPCFACPEHADYTMSTRVDDDVDVEHMCGPHFVATMATLGVEIATHGLDSL